MCTPALIHALMLWRVPGIGPRCFAQLQQAFPSLGDLFSESYTALSALGLSPVQIEGIRSPDKRGVEADLDWLRGAQNRHILLSTELDYPSLLRCITDPPPLLFLEGDAPLSALSRLQIAVVGSRRASTVGMQRADEFSRGLVCAGFAIVSGLALGIDAAAHQAALAVDGVTFAVMASGPDCIYPMRHRGLADRIREKGLLVTEFPVGQPPRGDQFPRRNRIISGLSVGTLVLEASLRSGSLITARMANEQGREVFAVPGDIADPLHTGCHRLIQQGAKLAYRCLDIFDEFPQDLLQNTLDEDSNKLLHSLGYRRASVERLVMRTGLSVQAVLAALSVLGRLGLVAMSGSGQYIRRVRR